MFKVPVADELTVANSLQGTCGKNKEVSFSGGDVCMTV